jgi:peptidyl-prolyl cis-trans isomerase SurA
MASKKSRREGSSFATKAVLYSKDQGQVQMEVYKMNRKTPFVKNLKMLLLVFKVRYLNI